MKIFDIMDPHMVTVAGTATIKELMALVMRHGHTDFPVVDHNGSFLGMVTEKGILHVLYPDARSRPANITEPAFVREILARYDHTRVSDIMVPDVQPLDADAAIMSAAPRIMLGGIPRIPVFKTGHLVGMVSQVRLFAEIMEEFAAHPPEPDSAALKLPGAKPSSPEMTSEQERRFFRRVNIQIPVAYRPTHVQAEGAGKLGTSVNISGGGLLLSTPEKIPLEMLLDVAFDLFNNGHPFKVTARVVRCLKGPEEGTFQIGLLFLDLSPEDRVKIIEHLDTIAPPTE